MAVTHTRLPLREDWSRSLLGPLYDQIQESRARITMMIREAQEVLAHHSLMPMVARAAIKESGKRGVPSVIITPEGVVCLEVSYGLPDAALRPLLVLQEEARTLGINPDTCGRSRKKLQQLVAAKREDMTQQSPPSPPKKMIKTAPALSKPVVVPPDSLPFGKPALASDVLDALDSPSPDLPAPVSGRKNLKSLADKSKDMDIEAILAKTPNQPLPPGSDS